MDDVNIILIMNKIWYTLISVEQEFTTEKYTLFGKNHGSY